MKKIILGVIVLVVVIIGWVYWEGILPVQVYINVGHSMEPTIKDGEAVGLNKFDTNYKKGSIVVVREPIENKEVIKRIIGVSGDTIEIKDGNVFINNTKLDESYIIGPTIAYGDQSKFVLASNEFFIMGDNRTVSKDSRAYGPIKVDRILGMARQKK